VLVGGAFAAALVVLVVAWRASVGAEDRALRRLPADERATLFERSWQSAVSLCEQAASEEAFRGRCASASTFLLAFPECDEACHGFAHANASPATR
jgi:hypothetical protein